MKPNQHTPEQMITILDHAATGGTARTAGERHRTPQPN